MNEALESKSGDQAEVDQHLLPINIGIIPVFRSKINISALKYIVLETNNHLPMFEFSFMILPPSLKDLHKFLFKKLLSKQESSRDDVKEKAANFVSDLRREWRNMERTHNTERDRLDHIVIVSDAKFTNVMYTIYEESFSVLALGNCEEYMSPPSVIEFIQLMLIRCALNTSLEDRGSKHLVTKGCVFDYTPNIRDLRYKVLNRFICISCREKIVKKFGSLYLKQLMDGMSRSWFGKSEEAGTPAYITSALGYELFVTKGYKIPFKQSFIETIKSDSMKEAIKIVQTIAITFIALKLGLTTSK